MSRPVKKTATVRAREGVRVPREGRPRTYITADEPRTIRLTPYYRRQLRDGDLVEVPPETTAPSPRRRRTEEGV